MSSLNTDISLAVVFKKIFRCPLFNTFLFANSLQIQEYGALHLINLLFPHLVMICSKSGLIWFIGS